MFEMAGNTEPPKYPAYKKGPRVKSHIIWSNYKPISNSSRIIRLLPMLWIFYWVSNW